MNRRLSVIARRLLARARADAFYRDRQMAVIAAQLERLRQELPVTR